VATSEKSKSAGDIPPDLMPIILKSGVLSERQYEEIRAKVLKGDYPYEPKALAQRLVRDKILTEYQVGRFLKNKPHGLVIDRYVVQDRLGSGSMGRVYKAQHMLMGRVVALKIIAPEIVTNTRVVARFQREMKMVGRLDHPNVVRAFDAGQLGTMLYIVMEYVVGKSLGQRFRAGGPLPPQEVAGYAAQAALGLDHAHSQGIVHRDVKPSNLHLTEDGTIKVLDLGLGVLMEADEQSSFATADGIAVGTIDYMSPEQACGKEVDGRSDLYSLGCAMYHLVTGRLPFPGDSPVERLGKRISGKPVPITEVKPDLPPAFVAIMDKLLATKPHERFQSGAEAAEALQALTRRKAKPASVRAAAPAPAVPIPPAEVAAPAPPPEPKVITVRPEYPGWFRPLAGLAERSPAGALAIVAGTLIVTFAAGFLLSMVLR
jgi:serine/threonine-protein kinase